MGRKTAMLPYRIELSDITKLHADKALERLLGRKLPSEQIPKELSVACAELPESAWSAMEERVHETVFAAEVEFTPGDWPKNGEPLRYVAVKFVGKQLDLAGNVSVKHLAVVSNRRDLEAEKLLRWHWEKAGTIEHVHDVVKNELGCGTFPSARLGANAAWFRFALLTYNVLSAMKQLALPPRMESARPKRMRFALFTLAARITWGSCDEARTQRGEACRLGRQPGAPRPARDDVGGFASPLHALRDLAVCADLRPPSSLPGYGEEFRACRRRTRNGRGARGGPGAPCVTSARTVL